jgi:hypothetical protein
VNESIIGGVVEEITTFDMEGESGIAVWLTDGRFLWVPSIDDRVMICETPRYKAN